MNAPDDKAKYFGSNAPDYARFRPQYPAALFDFLAAEAPDRRLAWDVATGNGQAATALGDRFDRVLATDVSPDQIGEAIVHDKVHYQVSPAESAPLHAGSTSLVTVAQAAHWFDLPKFYAEVRRVVRPGGVIAIWCYAFSKIDPKIDAVVDGFAKTTLGAHWSPKNQLVWDGYRALPFPFAPIDAPSFQMTAEWTLPQLEGYLRSWSASQAYQHVKRRDPLDEVRAALANAWGTSTKKRVATWELTLFCGRVP